MIAPASRVALVTGGGQGVTVNAICPGHVATELVWSAVRLLHDDRTNGETILLDGRTP